jgi:hypothetical protein
MIPKECKRLAEAAKVPTDEGRIRASAVSHGVPCITTLAGARAAVVALERLIEGSTPEVYALQDLLRQPTAPASR